MHGHEQSGEIAVGKMMDLIAKGKRKVNETHGFGSVLITVKDQNSITTPQLLVVR